LPLFGPPGRFWIELSGAFGLVIVALFGAVAPLCFGFGTVETVVAVWVVAVVAEFVSLLSFPPQPTKRAAANAVAASRESDRVVLVTFTA
jgi:hypothetical protein